MMVLTAGAQGWDTDGVGASGGRTAIRHIDGAVLSEVDRLMRAVVNEHRAPGVAYGVFDRNGLLAAGGAGTRDVHLGSGAVPDSHTQFRIASMSKSFAAAAVMRLVWQGKVDLHVPASRYVPQLRAFDEAVTRQFGGDAMPVTVHDLLSMSSGLPADDAWADRQEAMPRVRLQALLACPSRFDFAPGEGYAYSNLGYAVIGELIHVVSGIPCTEYVRRHFLEPLGLADTTYDWRAMDPARRAAGHSRAEDSEDGEDGGWQVEPFSDSGSFSAIGGVCSTVADVARWCAWLSGAFPAGSHNVDVVDTADDADAGTDVILPRRYRRLMQRSHVAEPPMLRSGSSRGWINRPDYPEVNGYGYGLVVSHDPHFGDVAGHSGGYPGYGSHMRWHLDSGIGVVVLANGRYAVPMYAAHRALGVLLNAADAVGRSVALWRETREAVTRVSAMLARVARAMECDADAPAAIVEQEFRAMDTAGLLAMNVPMDDPYDRRARELVRLLARTGVPMDSAAPIPGSLTAQTSAHATWKVRCVAHPLRCEVRLTGLQRPQIQTLEFAIGDAPRTDDIITITPGTRVVGNLA